MAREQVRKHIDEALNRTRGSEQIRNPQDMSRWIERAWSDLEDKRTNNCDDIDLADAQHYMEARWRVGSGGRAMHVSMQAMILGYAGMKFTAYTSGANLFLSNNALDFFRSGGCSPSPPHPDQVYWGSKGAVDGMFDYDWRSG